MPYCVVSFHAVQPDSSSTDDAINTDGSGVGWILEFQVYCIFPQVYNSKQHEMHVHHVKNFSMAVTLQLDC